VSLVERLVRHFDEPFADSSAIPTLIVSEFAAREVKVALTGDGGDELLAGYESFFQVDRARRFDRIPQAARRLLEALARTLPYRAYGKNYLHMISRRTPLDRYFELNYAPSSMLERLLESEWLPPAGAKAIASGIPDCLPAGDLDVLTSVMYFEMAANLSGDMLVKVDRMSMAASLEVRCPLLDHRLAEFAATLPHAWKMDNGKGKAIFLEAVGDRLPDPILRRGKMGFGVPLAEWFRGPLRPMLWDHLTSPAFFDRGMVRPAFVRYLLEEHQSGRRDNSHRLWALLMLELWFRHWVDRGAECSN
jgi:asparagine synthase (glutamine-hydrolysing)